MSEILYKCKDCDFGVVSYNSESDMMQCDCCLTEWRGQPEESNVKRRFALKDFLMLVMSVTFLVIAVRCSSESINEMGERIKRNGEGGATSIRY